VKPFNLGKIVWEESVHLGDDKLNIIAYHPWDLNKDNFCKDSFCDEMTLYYLPDLFLYTESLQSAMLVWIARRSLGYHSPELVAGICRMLNIDDPSVQRSGV
jgi:hypothetical protein